MPQLEPQGLGDTFVLPLRSWTPHSNFDRRISRPCVVQTASRACVGHHPAGRVLPIKCNQRLQRQPLTCQSRR